MKLKTIFSIKAKFIFLSILIPVLLVTIGILGTVTFKKVENEKKIFQTYIRLNNQLLTLNHQLDKENLLLNEVLNAREKKELKQTWKQHIELGNQINLSIASTIKEIEDFTNEEPVENLKELNSFLQTLHSAYNDSLYTIFQSIYQQKSVQILSESDPSELNDSSLSITNDYSNTTQESLLYELNEYQNIKQSYIQKIQAIKFIEITINQNQSILNKLAGRFNRYLNLIIAIGFILSILIAYFAINDTIKPIKQINKIIINLGKGKLPEKIISKRNDEIQTMVDSLNILIENLNKTRDFAIDVGNGNLDTKVNVFNNQGELGSALSEMRERLFKVAQERERQKQDENKRNWATRGLAQFGELLRKNTNNMIDLADNVIINLVKYLEANQGGLFLINNSDEENSYIEMLSCFAYDRKKAAQKKLRLEEGLVGRCIGEGETIYMSDIPQNYINITSGLGDSPPENLLIVPLKLNDAIFGAVEIASFNKFEDYHIEFVEKVGESIASTINSVQISQKTAQLLQQTQENTELMAAQEEELRQNLEEMQATQEEADRKEKQAIGFENTVNHTLIRADYSLSGHLKYANSRFLELMGYTTEEVEDENFILFHTNEDAEKFKQIMEEIAQGGKHFEGIVKFQTKNDYVYLVATYTVVRNIDGGLDRILFLAVNINPEIKHKIYIEHQLEKLKTEQKLLQVKHKKNEQELKNTKQKLRKIVDEKTKKESDSEPEKND